jgi:hypothetical protein
MLYEEHRRMLLQAFDGAENIEILQLYNSLFFGGHIKNTMVPLPVQAEL